MTFPKFLILPEWRSEERDYARYIVRAVRNWRNAVIPLIRDELNSYQDSALTNLYDRIDGLWEQYQQDLVNKQIGDIMRRVDRRQRDWWVQGVSKLTAVPVEGVDPIIREPWLADAIEERVAENVDLIKDIGIKARRSIQQIIQAEARSGLNTKAIAEQVSEVLDGAETRAKLIARDQVQKHNGALNQLRQQDAGIESYKWRTVGDKRVRPTHQDRDGKEFKWSEPPPDGHPGQPVLCRCTPSPIIPDSIYGLPVKEKYAA